MIEDSIIKTNFIGRDGFRWWIGQVAPEKSQGDQINGGGWGNRYKVRIMGYHPYTEVDLKNNDLPWAQVLLPTTAGSGAANQATSVKISPGDSVFGFFMDGDNAQIPVILGVFGRTDVVSSKQYQIPFLPYTGQTSKTKNDGANLNKREANESNVKSQKSPRHVEPSKVKRIAKDEISFFGGIGDQIHFASQSSQTVINKITTEVENFISAVQNGIRKASDLIDIVTDKIQSVVSGLVGSMIDAVFRKLAPLLNKGLKILYRLVYSAVLAATQNSTIAHLAGVAAQAAMVPGIRKIQEIIPCLANKIINGLVGLITRLLKSVINNMYRFSTCAANQFTGSLVNDIIQKIANGLKGVLGGVSKILNLVGGFDPAAFLRGSAKAIGGIASLLGCNEKKTDYDRPTNVWVIGRGPKEGYVPSFKDILKSANESAALVKDTFKSATSDITEGASEIGSAFETFSKNSKSSKSKCYTGKPVKCGRPKVKIFGGGGKGAKAIPLMGSVVGKGKDKTGSIIGVKVLKKGKKYRFPPFVEIVDECGLGYGAIARSVLNENGEVEYIYIVSEGENYPLSNETPYYVDDVKIIDSGENYSDGDYAMDQFDNKYPLDIVNGFIERVITDDVEDIVDPVIPNEDGDIERSSLPDGTELPERVRNQPKRVRRVNKRRSVSDLPDLTIISETGSGAVLFPVLDFIVPEDLEMETGLENIEGIGGEIDNIREESANTTNTRFRKTILKSIDCVD